MSRPHAALLGIARGEPIAEVLDPTLLLESAVEHRMTGLLWSRTRAGEVHLDTETARELEHIDLMTWGRHMKLWAGLGTISQRLREISVEFAVFKGIVSEHRWYDRVGERPCWDLDILLSPEDRGRLNQVVFHLQPDHSLAEVTQELFDRGLIQAVALWVDGIPVDLHFDLLKLGVSSRLESRIWEDTVWHQSPHLSRPVRVLSPETALLQYLVHHGRDRFRRLLGFVDVARTIEREAIDWELIGAMARAEGIEAPMAVALDAVADTLAVSVGEIPASGWRLRAWRVLWRPRIRLLGPGAEHRFTRRGKWLLPMLARGRAIEAVRWWMKTIFPPASLLDERHPGMRGPYLWRLLAGRFRFWAHQRRERIATSNAERALLPRRLK